MARKIAEVSGRASVRERVSGSEWETREELAAAFRAAYHFGWNRTISNHFTARLPDNPAHFLMNPRGLGWHEITASDLVKLDLDGTVLSDTELLPGPAGLNFHSAILRAKPEISCTMHLHPMQGVVISALEEGLQFYDQDGCSLYGQVSYHDFEGLAQEKDEAPRIIADLGGKFTMIMRNHGVLTIGRTIGEAFTYMDKLLHACETQVRIMSTGGTARQVSKEVCEHTFRQMEARRGNQPAGEFEWKMVRRMVRRLDASLA
ncbi:MAG TPA: class II aldolase/adducin family protein [Stellaceae bacterium]|nr:class II aldolase/adducin family protein [Stellaceae bacterium]